MQCTREGQEEAIEHAAADELPLTLLWGTWEVWCDIPQRQQAYTPEKANWLDQVKSIGLFDSAEGFWGIFNCTVLPSQLPPNASFYLFRKHIAPMWEHEANRRGGKWVIPFTSKAAKQENEMQPVDVAWQTLCLTAIGELFPCDEEEICGVTVSRGKQRVTPSGHPGAGASEWKLCLWTRSADDSATQLRIAKFLCQQLVADVQGGAEAGDKPTEERRPSQTLGARDGAGLPPTITYVAHRELMEAKQTYVKGSQGTTHPFKPKYTMALSA